MGVKNSLCTDKMEVGTNYSYVTTEQTSSAEDDAVIWSKVSEQLLNGLIN